MRRSVFVGVGVAVMVAGTAGWSHRSEAPRAGRRIVVQMLDISAMEYKFSLANIVVQPGDTVRFEQTGSMPHNVEFKTVPAAAKLGAAMSGRYLTVAGETYDLVIDNRFVPGEYHFICLPHETMGMKGILTVSAGK